MFYRNVDMYSAHSVDMKKAHAYFGPVLPDQQLKIIPSTDCGRNVRLKQVMRLKQTHPVHSNE